MKEELETMLEAMEDVVKYPENYDTQEMHTIFVALSCNIENLLAGE